jgi:hypothetical protein
MNRIKVALFNSNKFAIIDLDALGGATLGENLFYQGKVLDPKLILNSIVQAQAQQQSAGDQTTDTVIEGRSNKYFTNERAQDAIAAMLQDSANIVLVYDDGANTLTPDLTPTGVTPGVYGDAAHIPQLTIDEYGRITHVDLIPIALRSDFALLLESGDFLLTEAGDHLIGSTFA